MRKRNIELIQLYNTLHSVGNLKGVRFAYAVSKNIHKIKPHIESLQDSVKPSEEFQKYDKERLELAEKHAKKNKDGQPNKITDLDNNTQSYDIENEEKFQKELKKLQSKYKDALEEREKQIEKYKELLQEEADVELYKIKVEDLPEDITPQQMTNLFMIIDDEGNNI